MVAVVVLAAAWPCPIAFGNHYILCQNEKCDVFEVPEEVKAPGNAGWTVDQVYSNANGSIQYIVLLKGGGQECRDLSVFSIHDGETSGVIWPNFQSGPDSFDHLLIATTGFGILVSCSQMPGYTMAFSEPGQVSSESATPSTTTRRCRPMA
jgi:hypothetical protein